MQVDQVNPVKDCLYPSNNEYGIPTLLTYNQPTELILPLRTWGVNKRSLQDKDGTICFYVDDYRFTALWKNPERIILNNPKYICEVNFSLYDITPPAFGLYLIYKKRWLSRWVQSYGIGVYADLNVSPAFYEYNKLGIPNGYNAFSTRGYSDRPHYVEKEINIAKEISGNNNPFIIVYGGGKKIREICAKNNLIYIESYINREVK